MSWARKMGRARAFSLPAPQRRKAWGEWRTLFGRLNPEARLFSSRLARSLSFQRAMAGHLPPSVATPATKVTR